MLSMVWAFCALTAPDLPALSVALRRNDDVAYREIMTKLPNGGCRDVRLVPTGPSPRPTAARSMGPLGEWLMDDGTCLSVTMIMVGEEPALTWNEKQELTPCKEQNA